MTWLMAPPPPPAVERRSFSEVRSNGRGLEGYGATFNSERHLSFFVETIGPSAFRCARAGDVLASPHLKRLSEKPPRYVDPPGQKKAPASAGTDAEADLSTGAERLADDTACREGAQ